MAKRRQSVRAPRKAANPRAVNPKLYNRLVQNEQQKRQAQARDNVTVPRRSLSEQQRPQPPPHLKPKVDAPMGDLLWEQIVDEIQGYKESFQERVSQYFNHTCSEKEMISFVYENFEDSEEPCSPNDTQMEASEESSADSSSLDDRKRNHFVCIVGVL
jgi:hypothetical protein